MAAVSYLHQLLTEGPPWFTVHGVGPDGQGVVEVGQVRPRHLGPALLPQHVQEPRLGAPQLGVHRGDQRAAAVILQVVNLH